MSVGGVLAGAAAVAWLVAAVAALRLMRYRLPGRSAGWYAVRGHAFLSAANFVPEGAATQRVFLLGALGFALALVALMAWALGNVR